MHSLIWAFKKETTVRMWISLTLLCVLTASLAGADTSLNDEVRQAMRTATQYMSSYNNHGGYLWNYALDGSGQWGEIPARKTQVWVQSGTATMGEVFLDAWEATGDEYYLELGKDVADCLVWGQHPLGGWHYFIDFDPTGTQEWYDTVASRNRSGYEEYRHFYGNCTFDDDVTQCSARYLLRYYMATQDAAYRKPVIKAMDFIVMAQYPNGGWPQRYPLRYEYAHDGYEDYTHRYTLNDGAARNNIWTLVEAWERLGIDRYREAARRGADFLILAQLPEPQAAWCDQYDMNIQPAWARTHEPPAILSRQTKNTVLTLMDFFLFTGDKRYLAPVPGAIDWMKRSAIKVMDDGKYGLARFYDIGTNLKVNYVFTDRDTPEGYAVVELRDPVPLKEEYIWTTIDVDGIEQRYDQLKEMDPEEAGKEWRRRTHGIPAVSSETVKAHMDAMSGDGAWVEDIDVRASPKVFTEPDGQVRIVNDIITVRGISTRTYTANMRDFIHYLKNHNDIR